MTGEGASGTVILRIDNDVVARAFDKDVPLQDALGRTPGARSGFFFFAHPRKLVKADDCPNSAQCLQLLS